MAWNLALLTRPGVDILRRPTVRESVGVCDMRLVIFLAKSYKRTYRTWTNRSGIGRRVRYMHLVILWPRATTADIVHRPTVR